MPSPRPARPENLTPVRAGRRGGADGLPALPTEEQAVNFLRARKARATQTTEDYVEMIADLIDTAGEARVVDIARCLGVSHVTVIRTIGRLKKTRIDGRDVPLVTMKPYRAVFLTPQGRRMAERVRKRHQTVVRLLEAVGVDPETARTDAEGIEHHVSRETLAAFERFLERNG